jgi:DNA damage-binding protein 1
MAKYPGFFVNVMMNEELELQVPDPDDSPWKSGFVTFSAFVVFGVVPLLGYIILHTFLQDMANAMDILFGVACGLTGVMLFLLGALKTRFTRQKWYIGGGEIFLLGGACAATAYLIGMLIEVVLAGQGKTVHSCNNMTLYPNGSIVPAL